MKLFLFALFSVYTSCLVPDPVTPLVARVQNAGAGDLRNASVDSMMVWMDQHQQFAMQILPQCQAIVANRPTAHWVQSTEGRTCRAVVHSAELYMLKNARIVAVN